jgi:hypothetical protein
MGEQAAVTPWWAAVTTWAVVNLVNLLQGAGFLSRVVTGDRATNHLLGMGIIALALPAAAALYAFWRAHAPWRQWLGLVLFLVFVAFELVVDYLWVVEFRDPRRPAILVPYLLLFFGAILMMGLPMFRLDRRLWFVTLLTTLFLLAAMLWAMRHGVA